jgi:hypothetical protein
MFFISFDVVSKIFTIEVPNFEWVNEKETKLGDFCKSIKLHNIMGEEETRKPFNGDTNSYNDDDLNNWEYTSDGKRMCFINYISGLRVYHGDTLFHTLKNKMLQNYTNQGDN